MSLIQHYKCEILVTCGHHKAAIFELFLTGGLCKSNCPQNYYGDDPTEMLGERSNISYGRELKVITKK